MITKRYTEFSELDQTLKVFLGLKHLPALPKKKIHLPENEIGERQKGLEIYLKSLLNDKVYHHYSLFKFIDLSKEFEEDVRQHQTVISQSGESFEDF
jgi:PX domain